MKYTWALMLVVVLVPLPAPSLNPSPSLLWAPDLWSVRAQNSAVRRLITASGVDLCTTEVQPDEHAHAWILGMQGKYDIQHS